MASTKAALAREPRGAPIVVASMSGGQSTTTPIVPRPAEAPVVMLAADGPGEASADTVHWVPAVARTWVNVRNEAGRGADVVGVIKPASRAMLGGTGRAGWRQVRSDSATGWVDPKLFDADSARTRG
ncbi:MAG TPA: hypothetical protein VE869_01850 [Gemmatimonas sp.]|nr:hypothetical protein [Gemmatimonas sp.]